MTAPALSVVVAVKGAHGNLPDILAALRCEARQDIDFIFACAGDPPPNLSAAKGLRLVRSGQDALVPELWRDGILQAGAERVALIASHCIPDEQWLDCAAKADLFHHVGVGGAIRLAPGCGAVQKAIYLQRFSNYSPRRRAGVAADIAADNAVYRRDAITRHADLMASGFWEPSFHRRFARDGLKLAYDPALCVAFRGDDAPLQFMRARFSHGREYGRSRAKSLAWFRRFALIAASPLIAPVLIGRVIGRAVGDSTLRGPLFSALPWLIVFAAAWSAGEARGYLDGSYGEGGSRA